MLNQSPADLGIRDESVFSGFGISHFRWNRLHFQDCLSRLYLWPTRSAVRPIRPLPSASPLQKRLVHSALAFIPTPSAIAQTLRPMAVPRMVKIMIRGSCLFNATQIFHLNTKCGMIAAIAWPDWSRHDDPMVTCPGVTE
jgi:hypothetical protein